MTIWCGNVLDVEEGDSLSFMFSIMVQRSNNVDAELPRQLVSKLCA